MDIRSLPYALDRGLDGIDHVGSESVDALPDGQPALLPPGTPVNAQLRNLLEKPDLAAYLSAMFGPPADAPMLTPQRFNQALNGAADELRQTLENHAGARTPRADGRLGANATEKTLQRALRVVKGAQALGAELMVNQNLLLKA